MSRKKNTITEHSLPMTPRERAKKLRRYYEIMKAKATSASSQRGDHNAKENPPNTTVKATKLGKTRKKKKKKKKKKAQRADPVCDFFTDGWNAVWHKLYKREGFFLFYFSAADVKCRLPYFTIMQITFVFPLRPLSSFWIVWKSNTVLHHENMPI